MVHHVGVQSRHWNIRKSTNENTQLKYFFGMLSLQLFIVCSFNSKVNFFSTWVNFIEINLFPLGVD